MRSVLGAIAISVSAGCAMLGCKSSCLVEPSCDSFTEPFAVPFSGNADRLANARFELCRDDGCLATSMAPSGASCLPFVPEAPVSCSRSADGSILVDDRGALGGTIRVRIVGRDADGREVLLAERSVEMVREDYEATDSCSEEPKQCVRYVPR